MSYEDQNALPNGEKEANSNCHISSMLKHLPLIEHLIEDIKTNYGQLGGTYTKCLTLLETLRSVMNRKGETNGYSFGVFKKLHSYLDGLCDARADKAGERSTTSSWSLESVLKTVQNGEEDEKNILKTLCDYLVNIIDEEGDHGDSSPQSVAKDPDETSRDQEHILPDYNNQEEQEVSLIANYVSLSTDEEDGLERLDPLAAVTVVSTVRAEVGAQDVVVLLDDSDEEDEVCIIETRNSPICLDTDDDEVDPPNLTSEEPEAKALDESSVGRSSIRTQLAATCANFSYLQNVPSILKPRLHLIDSIEISDSDSDGDPPEQGTCEEQSKRDFLDSMQLMPTQTFRKITRRTQPARLYSGTQELTKESAARDWLQELCHKFACPQVAIPAETQVLMHQVLPPEIFECLLKRRYHLSSQGWYHPDDKTKTFLRSMFFTTPGQEQLSEAGWRMWHFKCAGTLERNGANSSHNATRFTGMSRIGGAAVGAGSRGRPRKKDDDEYTPPAQANGADGHTVRRSLRQNRKRSSDQSFTYNEDLLQPDFEEEAKERARAAEQHKVDQMRHEARQRSRQRAKSFERYFMGSSKCESS